MISGTKRDSTELDNELPGGGSSKSENGFPAGRNTATRRLIDEAMPVLFLGEGNFSFSTAVAAQRGSWHDICATNNLKVLPSYHEVLLDQLKNSYAEWPKEGKPFSRSDVVPLSKILNLTPPDAGNWVAGVDATKLCDFFANQPDREKFKRNIFFQCPWVLQGDTHKLLVDTVTSAAAIQSAGDYLFFGLISGSKYREDYNVPDLHKHLIQKGYQWLADQDVYADKDNVARTCFQYGYKHYSASSRDLHQIIRSSHVTHCFKKVQ